ncbi:MAG: diguanylate cyclase response regulator [Firmicutes bacterium HGW-Firmicutes-1]|jgi:diguanylate cyclase (GGDEF)-like protein|nr:MAG: diguanylate cyclase response regulator [Firmicutes bacterium HGW-Firmicutes-1]
MNNPYKIVVLDDNNQNLKLISDVLEDGGYDVSLCLTSYQLLDYLEEELPDIIILDVMVPDMNGFEVCKKIKEIEKLKDIPIIFLSAKTETVDIVYGLEIGGVDYVTKPFRPIELIARIKTHLEIKTIRDELKEKNEELIALNEQLEEYAIKDTLTKLYNRRMILAKFDEEMSRCKRNSEIFSIILLDIDHFKDINDNYGHNFGDEVLKVFANLLTSSKRLQDLVARWGGEEFLIILPSTDKKGAIIVAERIRQQISGHEYQASNGMIHITATFGVAEFNKEDSAEKIIKKADFALYYGKNNGRNQINAYDEINNE